MLVIIGLIVGGVLVGQDLIRAAEVRAPIRRLKNTTQRSIPFGINLTLYPGI